MRKTFEALHVLAFGAFAVLLVVAFLREERGGCNINGKPYTASECSRFLGNGGWE